MVHQQNMKFQRCHDFPKQMSSKQKRKVSLEPSASVSFAGPIDSLSSTSSFLPPHLERHVNGCVVDSGDMKFRRKSNMRSAINYMNPCRAMKDQISLSEFQSSRGSACEERLMDFPPLPSIFTMRSPFHVMASHHSMDPYNVGASHMYSQQHLSIGLRGRFQSFNHNNPVTVSPTLMNKQSPELQKKLMQQLQDASLTQSKRKERTPSTMSFPVKLFKILSDPKFSEYICWLPHGRAWRVLKPKPFEDDVIPQFFRSDRYASFMRQVNGWGFKRITDGPDLNAYYHEMFLRGLPKVVAKMRRPQKFESTPAKDLGQHPDFYKISRFAPLPSFEMDEEKNTSAQSLPCLSQDIEEAGPGSETSPALQSTFNEKKIITKGAVISEASEVTQSRSTDVTAKKINIEITEDPYRKETLEVAPDTPKDHISNFNGDKSNYSLRNVVAFGSPQISQATLGEHAEPASCIDVSASLYSPDFSMIDKNLVEMQSSPGESIHSWTEPHEHYISPQFIHQANQYPMSCYDQQHQHQHHNRADYNTGTHFYPCPMPGVVRPVSPRPNPAYSKVPRGATRDGLSMADIYYLSHQNSILLATNMAFSS